MREINFTDNPVTLKGPDRYTDMELDTGKLVKGWRKSLYAFEWLDKSGSIKSGEDMEESIRRRFETAVEDIRQSKSVQKPVLGIGIADSVEVGSGVEVVAAATFLGYKSLKVHVLSSCVRDFEIYRK